MISVIILGGGNVATHLISAFCGAKDINLKQIYVRNKEHLKVKPYMPEVISDLSQLDEADVYIMSISDGAIADFSSQLKFKNKLVVHTSGSVPMNSLKNLGNKGVFYPVQTFSVHHKFAFDEVPICLETERDDDLVLLEKVASAISNNVYYLDSSQRKYLHVAAIFINNFVNQMYKIGYEICEEHTIPFEILQPLIVETGAKIANVNPVEVQTGPAHRNDTKTIANHLELLKGEKREIYKLLTQSIKNTYGKKL